MPRLFAFLADVAVSTIGVRGGATVDSIKSVTDVDFRAACARLDRFAINDSGRTGSESVGHEDGGPEAHVELLVGEQSTLASLNNVSDGDVVEYNSGVRTGELCRKLS
jgi:hypothetical protein